MNTPILLALLLATPGGTPAAPAASPAAPPDAAVAELTLEAALRELDAQSLTLAQARSRADEAGALVRQSAAALLPTLTAQGTYLRNSEGVTLALPGGPERVIQPDESLSVTATARVPLLVPTAWFDLAAARDAARAEDLGAEATRRTLRTGLAQSAHGAASAEEVVAASERAVESAAELVRSAERRVAAGTAAPLDVLKSRTEQVRRESDLVSARAGLERARLALGILLGRRDPVRVVVPDGTTAPAPELDVPAEALAGEALEHRPEIAAQDARVAAAESGVRSAWARLAPQLSASGSAFAADTPYVSGEKDGWRVTLDLTWQLYDGGFRYGKRRQAEAQAAGARAGAEAQRLAVRQEVEDGRRDLRVARERLRLADTQSRLAGETAASARRSFEAGIASSLDVIDANDRQYLAEIGLADARARLAQARLALGRALGRDL
ncbi:outer membrane efflux protein [Anaeromyxobacter dehalogenans 2CP-1]|uniref:Outer membrane efflux protein n=1 Tax=Anaeromyxobacter dehalogenans (strain ATCC BAA-258 / DSM 21875 / 2CP-1) TaxID=455488 RepID=B8JH01_ANAD2|nr:TolC family protein [Anaeromyxobacter dehalogenans]ACL66638.1 outer membrane efflux protein [Anaeromyxobacter dehalogenans 2CP-1]